MIAVGVAVVLAVVAWAALGTENFSSVSTTALDWVLANFGWLFTLAADLFLVLCVVIALSRFGRI
ncbi:BCCT family transporter, partial [Schumannella sp. 10F1B-5-1]|uniref:BCCT family transporter n=1 Tax=Schumannella sp. 10F1B-5-1 TaxID=2590780 RepID=UPI001C643D44